MTGSRATPVGDVAEWPAWRIDPDSRYLTGGGDRPLTADEWDQQIWPDCPACGTTVHVEPLDVHPIDAPEPVYVPGPWSCPVCVTLARIRWLVRPASGARPGRLEVGALAHERLSEVARPTWDEEYRIAPLGALYAVPVAPREDLDPVEWRLLDVGGGLIASGSLDG